MQIQLISGEIAWIIIANLHSTSKICISITGVSYNVLIKGDNIYINASSRNNGEDETISKKEFLTFFKAIEKVEAINTNSIKAIMPSSLYKKRSPLLAILITNLIIK